jgi:hypothetical protein
MGALLGLFGAVFLPLALIVYLMLSYFQEAISPSVLGVFAAAFMITLGFFFRSSLGGGLDTLLFGGNIVFLSMLLGWFIGDLFRPEWTLSL